MPRPNRLGVQIPLSSQFRCPVPGNTAKSRDLGSLFKDYDSRPLEATLCNKLRSGTGAPSDVRAHMYPEPEQPMSQAMKHWPAVSARFRKHEVSISETAYPYFLRAPL